MLLVSSFWYYLSLALFNDAVVVVVNECMASALLRHPIIIGNNMSSRTRSRVLTKNLKNGNNHQLLHHQHSRSATKDDHDDDDYDHHQHNEEACVDDQNKIHWLQSSTSHDSKSSSSAQHQKIAYQFFSANNNNNRRDNDDDNIQKGNTTTTTTTVLFCNGYQSCSLNGGGKVTAIKDYCCKNNVQFCCFDYRGHGFSGGDIVDMTLSDWINDARQILEEVVLKNIKDSNSSATHRNSSHKNRIILVGSSMGVTIALHLAMMLDDPPDNNNNSTNNIQIAGILGIASAPDFFHDLYYDPNNRDKKLQKQKENKQQQPTQNHDCHENNTDDDDPESRIFYLQTNYNTEAYEIPWKLIRDSKENWSLLDESSNQVRINNCPVHLIHGQCDEDVSYQKSLELASKIKEDNDGQPQEVTVTLIQSGDHRLSRPEDLQLICQVLDRIVT